MTSRVTPGSGRTKTVSFKKPKPAPENNPDNHIDSQLPGYLEIRIRSLKSVPTVNQMKTSNKLLLGLATVLLAGLLGINFVLKAEYDDIRKNPRPEEGFGFAEVPHFSHVRINSASPGILFSVQENAESTVQINEKYRGKIKVAVANDTLLITVAERIAAPKTPGNQQPVAAFIHAPQLKSIVFENGSGSIKDMKGKSLSVECKTNSRVTVYDSRIDNLHLTTSGKAILTIDEKNRIKNLHTNQRDRSRIFVGGMLLRNDVGRAKK